MVSLAPGALTPSWDEMGVLSPQLAKTNRAMMLRSKLKKRMDYPPEKAFRYERDL
jgi:hypothetical protein